MLALRGLASQPIQRSLLLRCALLQAVFGDDFHDFAESFRNQWDGNVGNLITDASRRPCLLDGLYHLNEFLLTLWLGRGNDLLRYGLWDWLLRDHHFLCLRNG